jgi:hypothetical protein
MIRSGLAVLATLAGAPAYAASGDPAYARVSYLEGELTVLRRGEAEPLLAGLNDLVLPGDQLTSAGGTFVELELPSAIFVRLSAGTTVVVDHLAPTLAVTMVSGSAVLSRSAAPPEASLDTSSLRVVVAPGAMARIDHHPLAPALVVRSLRGRSSLERGDEVSHLAVGEQIEISRGRDRRSRADDEPSDAFGRWNEERERLVRGYRAPEALADHYPGLYDLADHGRWVLIAGYGWCWVPRVAGDWRPYDDGFWQWYDAWGWTWVPAARWGFVTHHYGRWLFVGGHGWCWIPHRAFSPAWVVWVRYESYVGWAPCDFDGRPARRHRGHHREVDHGVWTWASHDKVPDERSHWRGDRPGAPRAASRPSSRISMADRTIEESALIQVNDPARDLAALPRGNVTRVEREPRPTSARPEPRRNVAPARREVVDLGPLPPAARRPPEPTRPPAVTRGPEARPEPSPVEVQPRRIPPAATIPEVRPPAVGPPALRRPDRPSIPAPAPRVMPAPPRRAPERVVPVPTRREPTQILPRPTPAPSHTFPSSPRPALPSIDRSRAPSPVSAPRPAVTPTPPKPPPPAVAAPAKADKPEKAHKRGK